MNDRTRARRSHRGAADRPAPPAPAPIGRAAPAPVNPRPEYPDRAGRFEIRTPNPDFRGVRHNVQFLNGVGHTDDAQRAAACAELGYQVTDSAAADAGADNAKGQA